MLKTHTIDANGKSLGVTASAAAKILMGKNSPNYVPNEVMNVKVVIINASKTKMTEKRLNKTLHETYSGHPGGFKTKNNAKILDIKGWKGLYELAVYGMLPANKLRPKMMKNLTIND